MKIINLTEKSTIYTSNAWLVMGEWNTLGDLNTLVDTGCDENIFQLIENINTGLGKRKIDQIVLTHSHSDHSALVLKLKERYNPKVLAMNIHVKGTDRVLQDGDQIRIGESSCEIIQVPVHSSDSVCLYCGQTGCLFSGDTPLPNSIGEPISDPHFPERFHRIWQQVRTIYPGHGPPRNKSA